MRRARRQTQSGDHILVEIVEDVAAAAGQDPAAVDDVIRTLVRMGLDQQIHFLTDAVERLAEGIESGVAAHVETEARDVLTDAQELHKMACAVAVRGYLGPFRPDESRSRRAPLLTEIGTARDGGKRTSLPASITPACGSVSSRR
jgi:hypothetical protein